MQKREKRENVDNKESERPQTAHKLLTYFKECIITKCSEMLSFG